MRCLFLGNFAVPWTTENEVASCFRELGWDIRCLQESELTAGRREPWVRLERACERGVDLVLYTRTWGLPPDRARSLWQHCAAHGVPTAALHLDLFFGLGSPKGQFPRHEMPAHDPMFRTAHVATPDGDHDAEWAAAGVNHHWLPPAVGCGSCFDGTPDPARWPQSVGFIGSRGYHPEHEWRPRLIDGLAERFGEEFVHISGETLPDGQALRGDALHDAYATLPLVVGDSCWVDRTPPETRYVSDRWYETLGRGGCPLWPRVAFLEETFGEYPWWEPWDSLDALEEAARWWLAHPDEREETRRRLVAQVRAEHTWSSRITELLALMGISPSAAATP